MVVTLPYSAADFEAVRDTFLEVITRVAVVQSYQVNIIDVAEKTLPRRRLFTTSIDVSMRILVDSLEEGERVINSLTKYFLNIELAKVGVEPITKIVSGPEIVVEFRSSQETKVPAQGQSWILIVAIGAGMFVAWSSLYLIYQGKANMVAPDDWQPLAAAQESAEKERIKLENVLQAAVVRFENMQNEAQRVRREADQHPVAAQEQQAALELEDVNRAEKIALLENTMQLEIKEIEEKMVLEREQRMATLMAEKRMLQDVMDERSSLVKMDAVLQTEDEVRRYRHRHRHRGTGIDTDTEKYTSPSVYRVCVCV